MCVCVYFALFHLHRFDFGLYSYPLSEPSSNWMHITNRRIKQEVGGASVFTDRAVCLS